MYVRTTLTSIALRAAVSAVAGLLVSVFAAVALSVVTVSSVDPLEVGRTISGSLAPVLSAIVGAGFSASVVVFGCLVAHDLLRSVGSWLVAERGLLLGPFRLIAWLAARIALAIVVALQFVWRSPVVVETVWLVLTIGKAVGLVLACITAVGLSAITYIGIIALGFASIGAGTHIIVAMLEDPPRPLTMALGIGAAIALTYIGVAAFTLCGWLAYRVTRAGLRRAAAFRLRTVVS